MKKIIYVIILVFVNTTFILAQKKFYFTTSIGNTIAITGSSYKPEKVVIYKNYDTLKREENHNVKQFSLGKGINFGGSFGYLFYKNFGIELGVYYFSGAKTISEKHLSENSLYNLDIDTTTTTISASMFKFNPSLVISKMFFKKTEFYAKVGITLGIAKINTSEKSKGYDDVKNINYKKERELIQNGGLALGFNSNMGVRYFITENLSLFAEVNFINLKYAPTKGKYLKITENEIDKLSTTKTNEKEFEYLDYINKKSDEINKNEPTKEIKKYQNFSNVGINFGVQFSF